MTATPGGVSRRAPLVGEDTDEVLAGLALSRDEIAELKTRHVVAGPSAGSEADAEGRSADR
jgi:crotonobetainyl-CoA:carnitine CoA-transferase CaiB-like acyl-CoA transferase